MGTGKRVYDLSERLVAYAAEAISLVEVLPDSRTGNHIAGQLLRSGTSPAPNYGEAEAAESRKDFVHKMGVCLKELRESRAWLRIIAHRQMLRDTQVLPLLNETEELISIFGASITTAKRNAAKSKGA
jgi:four helix bundle protein